MLSDKKIGIFFAAVILAIGGIVYELIIGTVSTYLLGDSVLQFSLTIGLMLFGMGIGSLIAPNFQANTEKTFVVSETILSLVGGSAPVILFGLFGFFDAGPLFYMSFVAIVILIGVLIGLEIPMIFKIITQKDKEVLILSRILTLDYVGSLFASIIFPLVLLPYLGLIRSAYIIGLSNLLTACIVFWFFRDRIVSGRRVLSGIIAVCFIILAGGTVYSNKIAWALDHRLYQDEIIFSEQTQYQKIVLTKFKDDLRLFLDGNLQFSAIDEYRYHEPLVHIPMGISNQHSNILILGGGDGLVAREVLKYPDVKKITLVDLDKAMTDLCSSYPLIVKINGNSLKDPKVTIVNDDALRFLDSGSELFDIIIIDLPDPNNEGLAKLYSQEFYRLAGRRMAKEGVLVTQATSPYFSNKTFWLIDSTIRSAGFATIPYHAQVPSFGEWGFVLGSKNQISQSDIRIGNIQTRFLDEDTLRTLFIFDKDLAPQSEKDFVSTFYDPLILSAYNEDVRRWDAK